MCLRKVSGRVKSKDNEGLLGRQKKEASKKKKKSVKKEKKWDIQWELAAR